MKISKNFIILTCFVSVSAFAGHINVDNHSNTSFSVSCGHHGDLGKSYLIEPGHNSQMDVHGDHHGSAYCEAIDHHGNILDSRNFDFHHGSESYNWEVSSHHY